MRFRLHQGPSEGSQDEIGFLNMNGGEDEIGPIRKIIVMTDDEVFEFEPSQLSMRGKTEYVGNRARGFWGWFTALIYGTKKYEW